MHKLTVLFIVLSFIFVPFVSAQDLTYQTAYSDYLHELEQYNREHNEYLAAKAQYQQAKTLAAETKARDETAQMLVARDKTIRAYLQAIRMKMLETQGVESSQRDGLSSRLETDVNWYATHSDAVASAGSLSDLVSDSEEAKSHFDEITTPLIYETLIVMPIAKVSELRKELSVLVSDTRNVSNEVRDSNSFDVSNADRWLLQVDGKVTRSLDKTIEASNLLVSLQGNERGPKNYTSTYNNALNLLTEAKQYIREANDYLGEVIRLVRTKK